MFLKSIKLAGFKSFVDPTFIQLNREVNAIVGPNGCGKSNIVDAVRWVIGEISAKQLRGKLMNDVIFSGSKQRQPVGKASVELVFDNSGGRIGGEYAGFGEFSIRREVVRDGASSYFINNTPCRRRDVMDLFLGTGLGARSYSIIEQGMISRLIEAKPDELRQHIGEAAGITKYRERRRETENRMRHTRDNLDRLNDLRDELDKQLRHLARQAKEAKKYQEYKEQRTKLYSQVKALQWREIEAKIIVQDEAVLAEKMLREECFEAQRELDNSMESLRSEQAGLNEALQSRQKAFYDITSQISSLEQKIQAAELKQQQAARELVENQEQQQEYEELVESHQEQIVELERDLEELLPQQGATEQAQERAQQALQVANTAMSQWQQKWDKLQAELTQASSQSEVLKTKLSHYSQQEQAQATRQETLQEQVSSLPIAATESSIEPLEAAAADLLEKKSRLASEQRSLQESKQDYRELLREKDQEIKATHKDLNDKERELATQQARQEAALSSDSKESQDWLAANSLTHVPRLASSLSVSVGWEIAVETVLRQHLDAICVDDLDAHLQGCDNLSAGQLMMLGKGRGAEWRPRLPLATLQQQVTSDWFISPWLSGVYTADSFSQACEVRKTLVDGESVITPAGHWLSKDWWRLNLPDSSSDSVLSREKDISRLVDEAGSLRRHVAQLEQEQISLESESAGIDDKLDVIAKEHLGVSERHANAMHELSSAQAQLSSLRDRLANCEQELSELNELKAGLAQQSADAQLALRNFGDKVPGLEVEKQDHLNRRDVVQSDLASAQQQAARAGQQADELAVRVGACDNQLKLLRDAHSRDERRLEVLRDREGEWHQTAEELLEMIPQTQEELQSSLTLRLDAERLLREQEDLMSSQQSQNSAYDNKRRDLQSKLQATQEKLTKLQMEREGLSVRQATLVEQLEESEVDLQEIMRDLPEQIDLQEQENMLNDVDKKISRLGPINLAAIDEYDTAQERKEYLDGQHDDLVEALSMLTQAIEKIDRESRQKFKLTYEQVNKNFQELFPKIFRGGNASLELTENDWLQAGVLVKAQPPGKRNSTIHMLSGGEKALTALALVFSMFRLNPAPFCLLDEVDAPLDDLNVGRYGELVRSMADDTQFLMISHNKISISMADQLLGITMQEPGVSRLVAVDMGEALEMVDA